MSGMLNVIGWSAVGLGIYGLMGRLVGKARRDLIWLALELAMVAVSAYRAEWGIVLYFTLLAAVMAWSFRVESARAANARREAKR